MYPELAIRELAANALIHQDFSVTGAGPMIEIRTLRPLRHREARPDQAHRAGQAAARRNTGSFSLKTSARSNSSGTASPARSAPPCSRSKPSNTSTNPGRKRAPTRNSPSTPADGNQGLDQQAHLGRQQAHPLLPQAGASAARSRTPAASSSSTSTRPSTSGPTSPWTSRSAAKPSTRNPTSSNKSPTAIPGAAARIPSSP
jgi:hypothetical protein